MHLSTQYTEFRDPIHLLYIPWHICGAEFILTFWLRGLAVSTEHQAKEERGMPASILAQDLLAICLIFSKGDTRTKLEEITRGVESYQESSDRHFGISRQDFRNLLWKLLYFDLSIGKKLDEVERWKIIPDTLLDEVELWEIIPDILLDTVELWEIIPDILGYRCAHFNDEGEGMSSFDDSLDPDESEISNAEYWYGYSEEMYRNRIQIKQDMKVFFSKPQIPMPQQVMEFLLRHGIDRHLLYHCSRPGKAS